MIRISDFKDYWNDIAGRLDLSRCLLVRTESELADKIKQVDGGELLLIVVVPSAESSWVNADNILERETVIVYAIKKVDRGNMDDADMLACMVLTQQAITDIKNNLYLDATDESSAWHEMAKRIDFGRLRTDPEYNYMGCDGYSLQLQLTTPGF